MLSAGQRKVWLSFDWEKEMSSKNGVATAYDSRHFSPEFALNLLLFWLSTASSLMSFESLRPTPELSFAVRHLELLYYDYSQPQPCSI